MTEPTSEIIAGFAAPQWPKDLWTQDLYKKFDLGPTPSLEQIEPKATELLSDIKTAISGAELVLGRRVDANIEKEPDVLPILMTSGFSGAERFGLLLMQKEIEQAQANRPKQE